VETALQGLRRPDDRIVWRPVAYTPRMDLAYGLADLAVSRAGASTIAELEAAGVPAVLVPYPFATADHQTANAAVVERAGAAVAVRDEELDGARLVEATGLLFDDEALARMRSAMAGLAEPEAARSLAALVDRVVAERGAGVGVMPEREA
jgi:UDP-N-acetylglucosamine--N-acetylmuramyl-(pentapeptide) pyrophosphoryl-undecaprenol N-acetylglucosamine transferase